MIKQLPGRFQNDQFSGWQAIGVIVGLLLLWAIVLGCGVWLNGNDQSSEKPVLGKSLVILGSIGLFGSFWLTLLLTRKKEADSSKPESK